MMSLSVPYIKQIKTVVQINITTEKILQEEFSLAHLPPLFNNVAWHLDYTSH